MWSKSLFIIILLAVYTLVPIADIAACDDCSLPPLTHKEIKDSSAGRMQDGFSSSAIHSNASKGASTADTGIDVHCPLCSNSVLSSCSYYNNEQLTAFSLANPIVLSAYIDPSFAITKPPEN
jgi:hypothetical protein